MVSVLALLSCSKERTAAFSGNVRTAYINLTGGEEASVRSTIDASGGPSSLWPVSWETSDIVYYYTGRNSAVTRTTDEEASGTEAGTVARRYVVPSADNGKTEIKVEVKYADGDDKVVLFPSGKGIGAGTMSDMNTLVIANGVPATQTGDFGDTHIAVAKGNLLELSGSSPNLTVTPVQAYLKFNMSDLNFGDRKVDKIVIKGKSGEKISGDMKVTFSGNVVNTVGLSGTGGTSVTISKVGSTFYDDRSYYVALMPGSYSGFKFEMYTDGVLTSIAEAYTETTLAKGSIVDVQDLKDHKNSIPTAVTMYPTEAAITQDMTKDVWLCMEPQDFDGRNISWELSADAPAAMSDQRKEYFEGVGWCYGVTLTPTKLSTGDNASDYADRTFTVTATVRDPETGTIFATETCTVTLGIWIDVGCVNSDNTKVLWCVGDLGYDSRTSKYGIKYKESDPFFGTSSVWRFLEYIPGSTTGRDIPAMKYAFGSSNNPWNKYGLKYPERTRVQREKGEWGLSGDYDTIDDPVVRWSGNVNVCMPTIDDAASLYSNSDWTTGGMKGTTMGYLDVKIPFPDLGCWWCSMDWMHPGFLSSSIESIIMGFQYLCYLDNEGFGITAPNPDDGTPQNAAGVYSRIRPIKYKN